MIRTLAPAGVVAALLIGGVAVAQDFTAPPTSGAVTLAGGFAPDPHTVSVLAGGRLDVGAADLGPGCAGFIAEAPDFRLFFTPGTLPLYISALAETDTTLVINDPNGRWHCDDDTGGNLNPLVMFPTPTAGQYDIWIGTYTNTATAPATLRISELP